MAACQVRVLTERQNEVDDTLETGFVRSIFILRIYKNLIYDKHYVIGAGFLLNMAVIVMYIFICNVI